jgi:CubicO group peptidase (beta-lactamase class C family)
MTRALSTRPWLRWPARIGLFIFLSVVLVYGWALLSLDSSPIARALVWGSADVRDLERFPYREIESSGSVAGFQVDSRPGIEMNREVGIGKGRSMPLHELLQETGTSAFLVAQDERLLVEEYLGEHQPESVFTSFSVAKSFLSALVGIAIDDGDIESMNDPVTTYIPELLGNDSRFGSLTIAHLLSMRSGLDYQEGGAPWDDDSLTYYHPDLRSLALDGATVKAEPGVDFYYNNYNPLLLGIVLERTTGESVAELMETRLWRPMGAEFDGSWSLDSEVNGFEKMESGVNSRARDYARFGMLYAKEGRSLDGTEVISPGWAAESTSIHADTGPDRYADYGFFWWVMRDSGRFYAAGNHGQFVFVDPKTDLVIVRLGERFGIDDWPSVIDQIAADLSEDSGR